MGDRIETKKLAKEVGVNVIPGKAINVKTEEDAIKLGLFFFLKLIIYRHHIRKIIFI